MMIPKEFIQTLLHNANIFDVIRSRVPLKKVGSNYMARCPFHFENTPSFSVNIPKRFFHCFGCGAHGDAIKFVMMFEDLGFREAVAKVAEDTGMRVPD